MFFYVIVLGFGALAGVIINILINHKDIVYTVIGSIVILLTGGFACFVLYYPFYFDSFRTMITTLVIVAVFFIVIYVALRLLVNAVSLRNEPLAQLDTGSGSHASKQSANVRISRTGTNGRVKTKTIGAIEVTRLNKTTLQSAKNTGQTAAMQPLPGSVSAVRSARADTMRQTETAHSALMSVPIPSEKLNAQQPGAASSSADDGAACSAQGLAQQSEAIAAPADIKAEYILQELPVQMPDIGAAQPDDEPDEIAQEPSVQMPDTAAAAQTDDEPAEIAPSVQVPDTAAAAQTDDEPVEIVQEPSVQMPDTAAATQTDDEPDEIAQEPSVQMPDTAAAQTDDEPAEIVQEPSVQLPDTAAAVQTDEEPAEIAQKLPVQQAGNAPAAIQEPVADKYSMLLDKAVELINDYKYAYAVQLLTACLSGPSSFTQQKQADILLMECLVLSEQYDQARKKWLEVLNKMYILEPSDKLKLKQILIKIDSRNRQVS